MKYSSTKSITVLASIFTLLPVLAHAHTGTGLHTHGFGGGLIHPLTGWDHILAMVAVGLWAVQLGGRAIWIVPATFVSVMTLGGALGMAGVGVPFVEQGILLSVLLLGVFIAAAVRLPIAISMIIVGLFAVCHGYAHGAEMPETAAGFAYGAGFVLSTILLHASGIATGLLTRHFARLQWVRFAGAAIIVGAAVLWIG